MIRMSQGGRMRAVKSASKPPVTVDGATLEVLPTPRRIDLKKLKQVRIEMARVYRDTRQEKLDTHDASRFVYMLAQIGKMIELADLEERLDRLEENKIEQT